MKKYINQEDMKRINVSDTFSLIRKHRALTRKQISELTGFSWGGVSKFVSLLLDMNLIVERPVEEPGKKGRTAHTLEINRKNNYIIGIDVNISGIHGTVINLMNEVLDRQDITADYSSKQALLNCIFSMIEDLLDRFSSSNILGVGIAMQGAVNSDNGISVRLNQCPGWRDIDLVRIIKERYDLDACLEHDPNCILLAHAEDNHMQDAMLFRVDKGVGMAVIKSGQLISGENMLEIGHTTVVYEDALPCFCGNRGCLETYSSQNGIVARAGKPFEEVLIKARNGSEKERKYFADMAKYLGISIANMMRIFYINKLVFCGSMMSHRDLFWSDMTQAIQDYSVNDGQTFPPEITVLERENAAYGAAILASERIIAGLNVK